MNIHTGSQPQSAIDLIERNALLEAELDIARTTISAMADKIKALSSQVSTDAPEEQGKPVSEIVRGVLADFPGITWADIIGSRRQKMLVKPRQLCMVAVYEQRRDLPIPMIARLFRRDPSTIWHVVKKYNGERRS